jgi:hypothetical protein
MPLHALHASPPADHASPSPPPRAVRRSMTTPQARREAAATADDDAAGAKRPAVCSSPIHLLSLPLPPARHRARHPSLTPILSRVSVPSCGYCHCSGRTAATNNELAAVPAEWRDLSPLPLRAMQARAFATMATGADLVVNAATGSGKGLLLALPAAAAWAACAPDAMAPVDLVIVPYKALGLHHEKVINELFQMLANEGKMRPGARALFVRRARRATSAEEVDEPTSTPTEEPTPKLNELTLGAEQVRRVVHWVEFFSDPRPLRRPPRRCRSPPAPRPPARRRRDGASCASERSPSTSACMGSQHHN